MSDKQTPAVRPEAPADGGWTSLKAAQHLATALHNKHFPEVTQWRVADDLMGVILQIDNAAAGLARVRPSPADGKLVEFLRTLKIGAHPSVDNEYLMEFPLTGAEARRIDAILARFPSPDSNVDAAGPRDTAAIGCADEVSRQ